MPPWTCSRCPKTHVTGGRRVASDQTVAGPNPRARTPSSLLRSHRAGATTAPPAGLSLSGLYATHSRPQETGTEETPPTRPFGQTGSARNQPRPNDRPDTDSDVRESGPHGPDGRSKDLFGWLKAAIRGPWSRSSLPLAVLAFTFALGAGAIAQPPTTGPSGVRPLVPNISGPGTSATSPSAPGGAAGGKGSSVADPTTPGIGSGSGTKAATTPPVDVPIYQIVIPINGDRRPDGGYYFVPEELSAILASTRQIERAGAWAVEAIDYRIVFEKPDPFFGFLGPTIEMSLTVTTRDEQTQLPLPIARRDVQQILEVSKLLAGNPSADDTTVRPNNAASTTPLPQTDDAEKPPGTAVKRERLETSWTADGGELRVIVPTAGRHRIVVRALAASVSTGGGRSLRLALLPHPSATVQLERDDARQDVHGVTLEVGSSVVRPNWGEPLPLGNVSSLKLDWQPRPASRGASGQPATISDAGESSVEMLTRIDAKPDEITAEVRLRLTAPPTALRPEMLDLSVAAPWHLSSGAPGLDAGAEQSSGGDGTGRVGFRLPGIDETSVAGWRTIRLRAERHHLPGRLTLPDLRIRGVAVAADWLDFHAAAPLRLVNDLAVNGADAIGPAADEPRAAASLPIANRATFRRLWDEGTAPVARPAGAGPSPATGAGKGPSAAIQTPPLGTPAVPPVSATPTGAATESTLPPSIVRDLLTEPTSSLVIELDPPVVTYEKIAHAYQLIGRAMRLEVSATLAPSSRRYEWLRWSVDPLLEVSRITTDEFAPARVLHWTRRGTQIDLLLDRGDRPTETRPLLLWKVEPAQSLPMPLRGRPPIVRPLDGTVIAAELRIFRDEDTSCRVSAVDPSDPSSGAGISVPETAVVTVPPLPSVDTVSMPAFVTDDTDADAGFATDFPAEDAVRVPDETNLDDTESATVEALLQEGGAIPSVPTDAVPGGDDSATDGRWLSDTAAPLERFRRGWGRLVTSLRWTNGDAALAPLAPDDGEPVGQAGDGKSVPAANPWDLLRVTVSVAPPRWDHREVIRLIHQGDTWLVESRFDVTAVNRGAIGQLTLNLPAGVAEITSISPPAELTQLTSPTPASRRVAIRFQDPIREPGRITVTARLETPNQQVAFEDIRVASPAASERYVMLPREFEPGRRCRWDTTGLQAAAPEQFLEGTLSGEFDTYRVVGDRPRAELVSIEARDQWRWPILLADAHLKVGPAGDTIGNLTLIVRTSGRAELPLSLPDGVELLLVSIDGVPVVPRRGPPRLLRVPLGPRSLPCQVDIFFRGRLTDQTGRPVKALAPERPVTLELPTTPDLPWEQTLWDVSVDGRQTHFGRAKLSLTPTVRRPIDGSSPAKTDVADSILPTSETALAAPRPASPPMFDRPPAELSGTPVAVASDGPPEDAASLAIQAAEVASTAAEASAAGDLTMPRLEAICDVLETAGPMLRTLSEDQRRSWLAAWLRSGDGLAARLKRRIVRSLSSPGTSSSTGKTTASTDSPPSVIGTTNAGDANSSELAASPAPSGAETSVSGPAERIVARWERLRRSAVETDEPVTVTPASGSPATSSSAISPPGTSPSRAESGGLPGSWAIRPTISPTNLNRAFPGSASTLELRIAPLPQTDAAWSIWTTGLPRSKAWPIGCAIMLLIGGVVWRRQARRWLPDSALPTPRRRPPSTIVVGAGRARADQDTSPSVDEEQSVSAADEARASTEQRSTRHSIWSGGMTFVVAILTVAAWLGLFGTASALVFGLAAAAVLLTLLAAVWARRGGLSGRRIGGNRRGHVHTAPTAVQVARAGAASRPRQTADE